MPGEGVASSENKEAVVVLGTCDYPALLDKHCSVSALFSEVKMQTKTLLHLVILASHLSCDRLGEFMRQSYSQLYFSDFIILACGQEDLGLGLLTPCLKAGC